MSHCFHIGAVKEVTADEITERDIVIFKGEPRNISTLKKTANRIYLRFDYLASSGWDLTLTKTAKVAILGAKRVTGLKERKS